MACGIWDYAPVFGLFTCRCRERFDTAEDMDRHLESTDD